MIAVEFGLKLSRALSYAYVVQLTNAGVPEGLGVGDAVGEGDGVGVDVGGGLGLADRVGDGAAVAVGVGGCAVGAGVPLGLADGLGPDVGAVLNVGVAVGNGDAVDNVCDGAADCVVVGVVAGTCGRLLPPPEQPPNNETTPAYRTKTAGPRRIDLSEGGGIGSILWHAALRP